ncbi:succinylglutamate desuccinylase/aspartoacylase domain-containing protein [Zooshikella ganghwensis]|uniref:Succinylglutamate desuccinylase/Aspartoacylase catalytic domain-containing protein n=1 Tax=Zooshikella ganghwensis TaxID=202772 RepID=A0A4P9VMU8_9GAMM|nr:succinylglutamate desuccinylase/aspartoacylase family protein [Zooshikella ganghwensis]RDH43252.1 hypothetical protein B9G39_07250 [Zooshikella ganghwensis]
MPVNRRLLHVIENPQLQQWPTTPELFLEQLSYPTLFWIQGKDTSRHRAIVTLLHGNEPSGLIAIHKWLTHSFFTPAVNTIIIIAAVQTALTSPRFSYRHLPHIRDLNRCFNGPYDDLAGFLAESILTHLDHYQPEAIIDIHNTSGKGPDFSVSISADQQHQQLVSLFTNQMIITEIKLGALMELSERSVPSVTIECGGANCNTSHAVAYQGLLRYLQEENLYSTVIPKALEIMYHPVRLQVKENTIINYASQYCSYTDLTLREDIEQFNFGVITPEMPLGWTKHNSRGIFQLLNAAGKNAFEEYFCIKEHTLYPTQTLKLFMITRNPTIAVEDCLLYAVKVPPL